MPRAEGWVGMIEIQETEKNKEFPWKNIGWIVLAFLIYYGGWVIYLQFFKKDGAKEILSKDRGYIELRLEGNAASAENPSKILARLTKFEVDHQNLRILRFEIEQHTARDPASGRVFGIWIEYEPAPK